MNDWTYDALCWMTMRGVIAGKEGKIVGRDRALRLTKGLKTVILNYM